jgi:hypothetical protein
MEKPGCIRGLRIMQGNFRQLFSTHPTTIYFLCHSFFAAPSGDPLRISKKQAFGANEKP